MHEGSTKHWFAAREALKGYTKVLNRSRPQGRSQESSNEAFSQNSKRGHTLAAVPRESSRAHVAVCGTLSTWSSAESTDLIEAHRSAKAGDEDKTNRASRPTCCNYPTLDRQHLRCWMRQRPPRSGKLPQSGAGRQRRKHSKERGTANSRQGRAQPTAGKEEHTQQQAEVPRQQQTEVSRTCTGTKRSASLPSASGGGEIKRSTSSRAGGAHEAHQASAHPAKVNEEVTCAVAWVAMMRMHRMSLMHLHSGHLDRVLLTVFCTGFSI